MNLRSNQEPEKSRLKEVTINFENLNNLIYRGLLDEAYQETKKLLKVENETIKYGAKDFQDVKNSIDLEKVSIDGENVIGLKDQLDTLKENKSYLFGETKVTSASTSTEDGGKEAKSFYTREEVDAMSSQDKRVNYKQIMESQKNW